VQAPVISPLKASPTKSRKVNQHLGLIGKLTGWSGD
jgi:hypothetical protein